MENNTRNDERWDTARREDPLIELAQSYAGRSGDTALALVQLYEGIEHAYRAAVMQPSATFSSSSANGG